MDSPSLLVRVLLTFVVGETFLDGLLLSHLLHESRVLLLLHILGLHVFYEIDLARLDEAVECVHSLLHLSSLAEVTGLLDGFVDFRCVLIDEDGEHLLRVDLLAILVLGLSVYHNLLSPQGLRAGHHLLRLHLAHGVVQLLHVSIAADKHLWSDHLLLLSLVGEALCVEELVLHAWLSRVLCHHTRVDEDWSTLHKHCLLSILPWCTKRRLSCIRLAIALSGHHKLTKLASIHHWVDHGRLHPHWHLWLAVVLVWSSHLKFLRTVREGALASVWAGSPAFEELALDGLIVCALVETTAILLASLEATLVVASARVEEVRATSTAAAHLLAHSAATLVVVVVVASSEATAVTASVVESTAGHPSVITEATWAASTEVSLLEASSPTLRVVSISRSWVDGHAPHGIRFHMFGNRLF